MSFIYKCANAIASAAKLDDEKKELMSYGMKVLYINISKTLILITAAILLGILKETTMLFISYACVRTVGFGVHSNNTVKCTIIGLVEFIGGTYLSISIQPFSVISCVIIFLLSLLIFNIYAPIETSKRPISALHKRRFKTAVFIIATIMFIIALCIGKTVYRNLIITGVLLEAISMLPLMRRILQ